MAAKSGLLTAAILATALSGAHAIDVDSPEGETRLDTISWQQMTVEQRNELIKRFQDMKKQPDQESIDLQQRMNWFSQLPKSEQQKMREAWQNMSASECTYWRNKLKQANPEQREDLRVKILNKYD